MAPREEDMDWLYRDEPEQAEPTAVLRPDEVERIRHTDSRRAQQPGQSGYPAVAPYAAETPSGRAQRGPEPAPGAPAGPPPPPPAATKTKRRRKGRPVLRTIGILVLAWLLFLIGTPIYAWSNGTKVDAFPSGERPPEQPGTTVLLVGSDAREDLSAEDRSRLGTGSTEGRRTDTMMLLHTPTSGEPVLLSLPRDSYVEIPGQGMNKINAAFAIGGPPLLAATVEKATGLRVDGYVEIGFGGFADLVDSVGGVRMCLPTAISDEKAHIDLPAGCQVLDGTESLGYVRMRYSDPEGDLGRVKRQRAFLGALMGKLATPANVLLPWRLHSVGTAGGQAVTIGAEDGLLSTIGAFRGLRAVAGGSGNSVTVPVSNPGLPTPVGQAVEWDATKSAALFTALREGEDLPADLLPAAK